MALIVDGNGRWAQLRGLERHHGHAAGANVTIEVAKRAFGVGVETVSLYLFSTENWQRPKLEVDNIFALLERHLAGMSAFLFENNIRLAVVGQIKRLPQPCRDLIERISSESHKKSHVNQKTLVLALSYGGRNDIIEACRSIVSAGLSGDEIDEAVFAKHLSTGRLGISDPDLIIRTSGALRLSNFLLYQSAYTEFRSLEKLWPDLTPDEVEVVIRSFDGGERRFGAAVPPRGDHR